MATTTLEDSLAAVEGLRKADQDRFETMAREAADGQSPDPAELNRVLLSTGKDTGAFRSLVALFAKRTQLRQDIVTVQEANERQVELRAEIEKHNAELEKHVAAHQQACRPLQGEIGRLREVVQIKSGAERELYDTCPSEELIAKQREASSRVQSLSKAIHNEGESLGRIQADVPHQPPGTYDFRLNATRKRIADLQEQFEQAQADAKAAADAMRNY